MPNVYPSDWFKASRAHEGGAAYQNPRKGECVKGERPIVGRIQQVAYCFDGETIWIKILNQGAAI